MPQTWRSRPTTESTTCDTVDEGNGQIFRLVDAPDPEAANTVHREAHGLVADEIHEVREGD
jgi:hypothetical protein